jgi:hypothetical protein
LGAVATLVLAASPLLVNAAPVGTAMPPRSAQPQQQARRGALPGTVNFIEGQVSIDGQPIGQNEVGTAALGMNQTLSTQNGKAEVLLSPGEFLRLGDNAEIRMVNTGLVSPTVEVVHGEAMVEVDQKPKAAELIVLTNGATSSVLQPGLYEFNSNTGQIRVLAGKLKVIEPNGKSKEIGKDHEVLLNTPKLKENDFNAKKWENEDDLYRWSSVRSDYLAQANESTAQNIYLGYDPFWGPGWYWNPWFSAWSWMPGYGFWYSPFGYPFFSPAYAIYAPYYGGIGFRGGVVGRVGVAHSFAPRGPVAAPRFATGGGFAGRFGGGGFAGGGFHGGGFGGGMAGRR